MKVVNKTFGTEVTYTHIEDGSVETIKGVFDNAYTEISTGSVPIMSSSPILKIVLKDLSKEPEQGDLVVVNSVEYTVNESQPDSYGAAVLILEKN